MKHEMTAGPEFNLAEAKFVEGLRQHPELLARFQNILDLTNNTQGPLKTADEVEELLVQELRQLGSTTMHQWARLAEERVSDELQGLDGTVRSRKKKR